VKQEMIGLSLGGKRESTGSASFLSALSDREMQVFQLLGAAYIPREIAEQFHLSRKTIETHCEKIKHKLSLHNAAELKRFARQWATENLAPSGPWVVSASANVPATK